MKFVVTTFISVINQSIAHLMSWTIIILHFSKKFPGRNFYQNWASSNRSSSFDDPHSSTQPTFGYNQYYTEFFLCCGEQVHNQHISLCQHFFLHSTQPFSTNVACGIKNETHKTRQHGWCVGRLNVENGNNHGWKKLLQGNTLQVYILTLNTSF